MTKIEKTIKELNELIYAYNRNNEDLLFIDSKMQKKLVKFQIKALAKQREDILKEVGQIFEHPKFCKKRGEQFKECAKCVIEVLKKI